MTMKRISFITVFLLVAAVAAKSQIIPHYGETYEKETGKLRGKAWMSAVGFRQESTNDKGKTSVTIYRVDSAKVYHLDMEKKTWMAFPLSQLMDGTLSGIEAFERESHSVQRTLINQETVEGKACNHYRVVTATALKGGTTDRADWEEWIYEPDKMWIQRSDDIRAGRYLVHRNIVMGAQPAHLFEIPKDFKGSSFPAGGMMEMLQQSSGKSQAEIKDANKDAKSATDQLNNINNDPNKTQEQKIQEALKMLEGMNKK
jgi:hypothetical protein